MTKATLFLVMGLSEGVQCLSQSLGTGDSPLSREGKTGHKAISVANSLSLKLKKKARYVRPLCERLALACGLERAWAVTL